MCSPTHPQRIWVASCGEHFLGVQVGYTASSLLTEGVYTEGWTCVKMYEGFVLVRYVKMTDLETAALKEAFATCSSQEEEPHCRTTRKRMVIRRQKQ